MRRLHRVVATVAWLYPASLLGAIAAFRCVGERWWVTGVILYLPRILFAAPLPFVVASLVLVRLRSLLWTQFVAALLLVFPLMGCVLPWPASVARDAPVMRVLSYNVNSGANGFDIVIKEVDRFSPDIVVLEEVGESDALSSLLRTRYPTVNVVNQFLIATRYTILSTVDPDKLEAQGRLRSPRFVRQVLETPLGRIALYSVHPLSPREAFYELRGTGSRREFLLRGLIRDLFSRGSNAIFEANAGVRALQVRAFADDARKETEPVLIVGDTNLPGLSFVLHRDLSWLQDGFEKAGWGLGYTFPTARPWMRLDRVLASGQLRFVRFKVGNALGSDHLCVVADLQRRGP
jgi:endonuclease/exonuclease/phosphatase (EEP) superfamily protein YafD